MYGNKNDINIEHRCRKTQHIQRNKRHGAGEEYVDKVRAAAGQPVHILRGMMDRMEAP